MRSVRLKQVTKSFGGEKVLDNLDLHIPSGKFFALLGPSGCGKTTILRLIGGFESVDTGDIFVGNKQVTYVPSDQRRVNTVFQSYALFPHLSIFDNIAFSLTLRGEAKSRIRERVMRLVRAFGLKPHLHKNISQLSGGQKQRVALARAIINEPDVLLLDEPLAALDYKLREQMLVELIELQDELETTFVYVTHDPVEALTVADRMAIMNADGHVEQIGTPQEIYESPISTFAARFVGTANILVGNAVEQDGAHYLKVQDIGLLPVRIDTPSTPTITWKEGKKFFLSIRPEKMLITKKDLTGFSVKITGMVQSIVYYGHSTQYRVRITSGQVLRIFDQNEEHLAKEVIDYEEQVYIYWNEENGVVLER